MDLTFAPNMRILRGFTTRNRHGSVNLGGEIPITNV